MAFEDPLVVVASGARSTSGQSGGFSVDGSDLLNVLVNVTAAGTTITFNVQWSDDGGATWADADPVDAMTAITATGTKVKGFAVKGSMARVSWPTITGSFTFSVMIYTTL